MKNQTLKEMLEAQLGTLQQDEIDFAVEQFHRNSIQAGQPNRSIKTAESLNEIATTIDFYNWHCKGHITWKALEKAI